jgi:hypothetical protein
MKIIKEFLCCSCLASGTFTLFLLIYNICRDAVVKRLWSNLSFAFVPCYVVRGRHCWYLPLYHLVEQYEKLRTKPYHTYLYHREEGCIDKMLKELNLTTHIYTTEKKDA